MNEQLRQAYLRTMGISPLYPRMPVSGAQPSPRYDFSCPDFLVGSDSALPGTAEGIANSATAGSTQAAISPTAGARQERTRAARERLGLDSQQRRPDSAEAGSQPAAEAEQAVAAAAPADTADEVPGGALRFCLEYRRVSANLAVLFEVPLHAQPETSRQGVQLLENILLALEIRPTQDELAVEKFNWPLLEDLPVAETSARHATQALSGFIAMRQQRDSFANLLLFTNQSGQLVDLLPAEDATVDYRQEKLACWITRVSSLQEMLSVPAMKREVWQQLQPLRKRLQAD